MHDGEEKTWFIVLPFAFTYTLRKNNFCAHKQSFGGTRRMSTSCMGNLGVTSQMLINLFSNFSVGLHRLLYLVLPIIWTYVVL
jgi:hypothetical protein